MSKPRIYTIQFSAVYPLYVAKAERKGRSKTEVDQLISWLTGYSTQQIAQLASGEADLQALIDGAPQLNPARSAITGMICGVRVEEIEDPIEREIRYLDKLIDELAKGKPMAKILRE